MSADSDMPLSAHLLELRKRLLRFIIILGIAFIAGMPFNEYIYNYLSNPLMASLPTDGKLIATQVTSPVLVPIKTTFYAALLFCMPLFFIELWGFLKPGLYAHEKKLALPIIISTTILFFAGVCFGFYVATPVIFNFIHAFSPDNIFIMTDIGNYLSFMLKLLFAFGVAFEMPVIVNLLVRTGTISKARLREIRPHLIVLFFVIGMLLTPPDMFSQLFLALPMWLLFELGLLLSKEKI